MRIAEIEKLLIDGDCSDEMIEQFKAALKRVPRALRCQHCHATAVAMPSHCSARAIDLIHYGLGFCESWLDRMRAYYHMAVIYEKGKDFESALTCYKKALDAIPGQEMAYITDYASHMLRVEMHIHQFAYTDDLRRYYELSIQAHEFNQAFLKKMFYRELAEIIIFHHDGKIREAKNAIERAEAMLLPNYTGPLTALLKRKRFTETTGATEEAIAFLKKAKGGSP